MKVNLKYGSILPLVLVATACSTGLTKYGDHGTNGATRTIASVSTVDDTTEKFVGTAAVPVPEPQSISVKYSNADLRADTASYTTTVNVPLYISTQEAYPVQVDDYANHDIYGYYDCQVKVRRAGVEWVRNPVLIHEGWTRLNHARSNIEKANALADAVYGMGKPAAEKMIEHGLLRTMPKSWEAFSQTITRAGNAKILLPQQVNEILGNSGDYENHIRLGYSLSSANAYDVRAGRCYGFIRTERVRVGSHTETRYHTIKTQTGTVQRNLTINVRGGLLLPSEIEQIDLVVSANPNDLELSGGLHNNYQLTFTNGPQSTTFANGLSVVSSASTLNLIPIGRIRSEAPNSLLQDVTVTDEGSAGMKAVVTMSELAQELINVGTPAGNFLIHYDITGCKPFLGVCVNYKSIAERSVQAISQIQTLNIEPSLLKKKTRYKVKVTLEFTANAYFSGTTDHENSGGVARK
jgi:hypothetical protein